MDKLYIQLSRLGDILGILPMAYADAQKGLKVGVMVCSEFSSVLDGCSYVEKVEFPGKPWEIEKAVAEAKKLCANVICTQVNGPVAEVAKCTYAPAGQTNAVTDSFNREAWKVAGRLIEWGTHPLVFDKRDKVREGGWLPPATKGGKKKIILVSPGSTSSPFPYRELLMELLRLNYPKFNIIDLSTIRAERFYDLLGLYEAAHCLVSVDTGHLHLAFAVPSLPVMAIVQDQPLYWHGSAWRPQHHFHCRYHDFPTRALELFTAINKLTCSEPRTFALHVYPGAVRDNNIMVSFPIQPGACHRDSLNVLQDKERHPMLRNVVRMFLQSPSLHIACLTRKDTAITLDRDLLTVAPCYAYRMNRKGGNDTFAPIVDLFAATTEFWKAILPEIPDLVMGEDAFWSRVLVEIFKAKGAKEVEGIYRNA
jgi:hypothetical protein